MLGSAVVDGGMEWVGVTRADCLCLQSGNGTSCGG